jgi:hypothetical protein
MGNPDRTRVIDSSFYRGYSTDITLPTADGLLEGSTADTVAKGGRSTSGASFLSLLYGSPGLLRPRENVIAAAQQK